MTKIDPKLIKYFSKTKTKEVIHSNDYAKVANESFGAASAESFAERQRIEKNRKIVQKYRNSLIIQNNLPARKANGKVFSPDKIDKGTKRSMFFAEKSSDNLKPVNAPRKMPEGRSYNPYG